MMVTMVMSLVVTKVGIQMRAMVVWVKEGGDNK